MKKTATLILILLLTAILAVSLVACNNSENVTATFTLDENDGIADFSLRRGVVFNYKVAELNKIDGIKASWKVNKGKVVISVENGKHSLDDVLSAIDSMPNLEFRNSKTSTDVVFFGNGNIKIASVSLSGIVQVEFTAQGIENINRYYGGTLYLYTDNDFVAEISVNKMLNGSDSALPVEIASNSSDPIFKQSIVAQINAGAFGLKITDKKVKYRRLRLLGLKSDEV